MNQSFLNFFSIILTPVSTLWEWIYRLRRFLFKTNLISSNSFEVPIISIGNLSLGGTGKTPFTLWAGNYLDREHQARSMVLTRGYKGELERSSGIIVSGKKISENPFEFGDEALVLSRNLKNSTVVVGANRSQNLKKYFNDHEADVVLLDDGFQHLKIRRNLNIVLFDSLLPIQRYHCPPRGYLREGLSALTDADIIALGRADLVSEEKLEELEKLIRKHTQKDISIAHFKYAPSAIKSSLHEDIISKNDLTGKNVICVSGLASPKSFLKLVKQLNANIIDDFNYPDHHQYTIDEIKSLVSLAEEKDALILTTEKDIVKIKRCSSSDRIHYLQIGIEFLKGEEEIKRQLSSTLRGTHE